MYFPIRQIHGKKVKPIPNHKGNSISFIKEDTIKRHPTAVNYRQVLNLLNDFDIQVSSVPKCKTIGELLQWQRNKIKKQLSA